MAAHLSHKIRWDYMVDYLSAYEDPGITLPVGKCGRIHANKKKHAIQVEMRNYITDDMLCTTEDCEITGERTYRKNNKRKLFCTKGKRDEDERKLQMFTDSFHNAVHEFASTELQSPFKPVEYDNTTEEKELSLTFCDECNQFIRYLEFGDKQKLFEFSHSRMNNILSCLHGGQAVGNSIQFLLHHVLKFYVYSNVIVYLDLKEDEWPYFMKPKSYERQNLLHACDGQTFLPHSRHLLATAMIDVNETHLLSKRLFRFIYFYVMVRLKLDPSYSFKNDFPFWCYRYF